MIPNPELYKKLCAAFRETYRGTPTLAAYAPGRVEVLGNHTDYNEGFVLSAAIDRGIYFLAAPSSEKQCRLSAVDVHDSTEFPVDVSSPSETAAWSNYVKGVYVQMRERAGKAVAFNGLLGGDVPLGAGLSSSAALEMACGLALSDLFGISVSMQEMAKIGQTAEHTYAGVRCGLLDQITSLYGRRDTLVMTDFRHLAVDTVPLYGGLEFLIVNTGVKHRLVESAYNERRACCEEATRYFAGVLPHPVKALRDVSWSEWESHAAALPEVTARRVAHVIGENERVLEGARLLRKGAIRDFGALMFESHESSRTRFENSCPELDLLVNSARAIPDVLGARLSGGGFGGSAVVLLMPGSAEKVGAMLAAVYEKTFSHPCHEIRITAMDGAQRLTMG